MSTEQNTAETTPRPRSASWKGIVAATAAAALAVGAGVTWVAVDRAAADGRITAGLQTLIDVGYPAALAAVTENGTTRDYAAGIGDLETGAPAETGEVRIASNTKTFTATVVMQLVDEGKVALDAAIEQYLPGLIHGDGVDGSQVTIRQLLQHTSGLPDYTELAASDLKASATDYISPRDLLDLAFTLPAQFEPGAEWKYTNTNYLVLGLLIERLELRPLHEVVDTRIVQPLGLERTYFPGVGERELRGDHVKGYHPDDETGELVDATVQEPSIPWAAGAMVSTPGELNEFFVALLAGKLTSAESLAEMKKTVPGETEVIAGSGYGLGLASYPLSCGGEIWGHGGDIFGYETRNGVAADGRAVSLAITALPGTVSEVTTMEEAIAAYRVVYDVVDDAFCG
ncbi:MULTISPECIES: serine hydrolase domain-containing protein [unclassified Salinibacterium]|uniref:serine hydrolase domain-containing protein n=1 Tax=unclassified Salinibacterium TaxID=2632331 RepID=UPI001423E048|nr:MULTISPECIES: serine hydrolase domain-containing protein [unclassified Salinibacterium]